MADLMFKCRHTIKSFEATLVEMFGFENLSVRERHERNGKGGFNKLRLYYVENPKHDPEKPWEATIHVGTYHDRMAWVFEHARPFLVKQEQKS